MSKLKTLLLSNTTALGLIAAVPALAFTGADTFKAKCAMCHAQDGSGSTPMGQRLKIRDLRSAGVQAQTTEAITAIITTGKKTMPAFGKTLSADQIKELVGYIRSIAAK